MKRQSDTKETKARQAGAKIPDKPRGCGPHVDTWPILDTQVGDAPKPKADEYGNAKRG
jgi:hypothetical protein